MRHPIIAIVTICLATPIGLPSHASAADEPGVQLPLVGPSRLPLEEPPPVRLRTSPKLKSPGLAIALSIGGTLVPALVGVALAPATEGESLVLLAGAYILGPSIGHFYAGEWGRGFAHAGVRTLYMVGATLAIGLTFLANSLGAADARPCFSEGGCIGGESSSGAPGPGTIAVLVGSGVGGLLLMSYQIWDAGRAAKRVNKSRLATWHAAPLVTRTASGAQAYGLSISGRF